MAEETKVGLKLLIDRRAERVIFAEAGKDFVDFLFSLLHLPLGSIIRLLTSNNSGISAGSLPNLYESVKNLSETYLQGNANKDSLLKPVLSASSASGIPALLPKDALAAPLRKFYSCSTYYHYYVADDKGAVCPDCGQGMNTDLKHVAPPQKSSGGYVKGMVTYMVMDDLSVTHASLISTISVLNSANVKEFEALEAKDVEFGVDEGLKLLEACLWSRSALTYVFLGKEVVNDDDEEEEKDASDGECAVETWLNGAKIVKTLKE